MFTFATNIEIHDMKIIQGLEALPKFTKTVITIGTFDGVHLGHRKIIQRLSNKALELNVKSILITFEPHPRLVLEGQIAQISLLTTLSEKLQILEDLPIDYVVVVPFTKSFSELSAQDYISKFIVGNFDPQIIIMGYDHHFGKDRIGNIHFLKEVQSNFNFQIEEISAQEIEHVAVSSTKIREAIKTGNIDLASEFLCRNYLLTGHVVAGEQKGRTIGYPTANIQIENELKLIPKFGVYAVRIHTIAQHYFGMMNIGVRPTITNENKVSIETHLFNFNQDIYHQKIQVEIVERLRDEIKFESIDALKKQLAQDEMNARKVFEKK